MSALGEASRILVRAPNWLGDAVMATPALRALRAHAKDAHLVVHVREDLAPVFAASPHVDAVIPMAPGPHGPAGLWREATRVRAAGPFDVGVCLPDSHSSALLMRLAGVRRVAGFARGGRRWLLHDAVPIPEAWGPKRLVAREVSLLSLVEALGCAPQGMHLELCSTAEDDAAAERLLGEDARQVAKPLVLIAPGAAWGPSKRWPGDRFAALADALVERGDDVAFVGAAGEAALVDEIRGAMKQRVRSFAGRAPIGTLAALVRRARLVVANDSGLRHVAAATGTRVVMLLGPTAIEKTSENLGGVAVLSADVTCRPCQLPECPIDHRCMTRIEVDDVIAAATPD